MSVNSQLLLYRAAEAAWQEIIRPWLEAGRGRLMRRYVVVATRGQAQGLKQRCLVDGLPLLGVEFLTPGLARQKWRASWLAERSGVVRPTIGRELLLLGLRRLIARRREAEAAAGGEAGFWRSLDSDAERVLDDFDAVLGAGLTAEAFDLPALRELFEELSYWVEARGFGFAASEAIRAGGVAPSAGATPVAGGVLVYGLSAEMAEEFFNVAALVRRCPSVVVALPEPAWAGGAARDERWVAAWERLLETEAVGLDEAAEAAGPAGAAIAARWEGRHASASTGAALRAGTLAAAVGRTRTDEIDGVVRTVAERLARGAESIAVVVPPRVGLHARVVRALSAANIDFADVVGLKGSPPVDACLHARLIAFLAGGGTVDQLLELWPWLRAVGSVTMSMADARAGIEWSFDRVQNHRMDAHLEAWGERPRFSPLVNLARKLGPGWAERLSLGEAISRVDALCDVLELEAPGGWGALRAFAERETETLPRAVVAETLQSFVAGEAPAKDAPGRGQFSRVTVTTRRRAEGLAWSHVVFMGCNAGVWPKRRESSPWLSDARRAALATAGGWAWTLTTGGEQAAEERRGACRLASDTREEIILSAAAGEDGDRDVELAPNAWLEHVWADLPGQPTAGDIQTQFGAAAKRFRPTDSASSDSQLAHWHEVWRGRRDANRPFDEYFLGGAGEAGRPAQLSARRIESGLRDPAELWFEEILRVRPVGREPLSRNRRKALGQRAHELLAGVLGRETAGGGAPTEFARLPDREQSLEQLAAQLAWVRRRWPDDAFGASFHAELTHVVESLLRQVYTLDGAGPWIAAERALPPDASVTLPGGRRLRVTGRMDLVRLDRAEWLGARVDVIDFKTGRDAKLSAGRMASHGASLQLGLYLAALASVGARDGRVWMIKPTGEDATSLGMANLAEALAGLALLEQMLDTGVYGALAPGSKGYGPAGWTWPLAATPIAAEILQAKHTLSFGGGKGAAG